MAFFKYNEGRTPAITCRSRLPLPRSTQKSKSPDACAPGDSTLTSRRLERIIQRHARHVQVGLGAESERKSARVERRHGRVVKISVQIFRANGPAIVQLVFGPGAI